MNQNSIIDFTFKEEYNDFLEILFSSKWARYYDKTIIQWYKMHLNTLKYNDHYDFKELIDIFNCDNKIRLLNVIKNGNKNAIYWDGVYYWLARYKLGTDKEEILKGINDNYDEY
jgi:hypothetical protein